MLLHRQTGVATAQRHLTVASLYVGTANGHEHELVQALAAAARAPERPELQIHVLLDALRATRPSPAAAGDQSSNCLAGRTAILLVSNTPMLPWL